MDKDEDTIIISGSSDITLDISNYGAAQPTYTVDTLTLDGLDWNNMNTSYTVGTGSSGQSISWTDSNYNLGIGIDPSVNITTDGVEIKGEGDLKIGDRSMKEFMDKVEDQLAILRPAPELEEKWDKLKELRRQYEECKQDILEKEKIMKILKEE